MVESVVTFVNNPSREGIARAWEVIFRHYAKSNSQDLIPVLQDKTKTDKEPQQA